MFYTISQLLSKKLKFVLFLGFPKAAVLSHFASVNASRIEHVHQECPESNTNVCIPIPIFHTVNLFFLSISKYKFKFKFDLKKFGMTMGLVSSIVNGIQTTYPSFFPDTLSTIKAIQNEKCNALKGSPTIFIDLINNPNIKNYNLSSLQSILLGASTVPKDLLLRIKKELNIKHVLIGYFFLNFFKIEINIKDSLLFERWAMTETGCGGILTTASDIQRSEKHAYESIGTVSPFIEVKIVDQSTGNVVPRSVDGEIWIRSRFIMKMYWGDPEKTAESIDENGWFKTGDIGMAKKLLIYLKIILVLFYFNMVSLASMDEEGYVYFKSRAKEVIIRGGINIYPVNLSFSD